MSPVFLDGERLSIAALHRVAGGARAHLGDEARRRMERTAPFTRPVIREKWEWLVGGEAPADDEALVRQFVLGHCAGVGDPLPDPLVRALIAARANVLAKGYSGCRPEVVDALLALLARGVLPVVPSQGSVGAAGCPALAEVAAVVTGIGGRARVGDAIVAGPDAVREPLRPTQKEALSLLNGSTLTTALGAVAAARARRVLDAAVAAAAMTFEVVRADLGCLDGVALRARGQAGGEAIASRLRAQLAGSTLVGHGRRPDPFSVRCTPAVLGTALDALTQVEAVVTAELNGAVDNPLVLPDGRLVEVGNFHGAPVAVALDHLKIAMAQVASIADRRIFRMTYGQLSGLPSFLVASTGLNSGLMLAQYTAASRLSETKGLAHPASVDSLPIIQHREDHVSMGPVGAFAALELVEAVADVVAIELLCGAQGLDLQRARDAAHVSGSGTAATHAAVRARVAHWSDDRVLHPDLAAAAALVRSGVLSGDETPW